MDFASDLRIFEKFTKLLPSIFMENEKKEKKFGKVDAVQES